MGRVEEEKVPYEASETRSGLAPRKSKKGRRCETVPAGGDCTCDVNKTLSFMEFTFGDRHK